LMSFNSLFRFQFEIGSNTATTWSLEKHELKMKITTVWFLPTSLPLLIKRDRTSSGSINSWSTWNHVKCQANKQTMKTNNQISNKQVLCLALHLNSYWAAQLIVLRTAK
jgi:hypothetical protein